MTIKELRRWFELIPHKFDDVKIGDIDIDLTRDIGDLNLVITEKNGAIIATLMRKPTYIETEEKE